MSHTQMAHASQSETTASRTQVLTTSTHALVVAMRLWHFEHESWWTKMQALCAPLGTHAACNLTMALDGLMTVVAEHSLCDITLRPVSCKRLSVEEHAFVHAMERAGVHDETGCREALSRFLDGENLRFAHSLLGGIADHLSALPDSAAGDGGADTPAAACC